MAEATDDRDPVEVLAEQFTEEQRHGRNPSIDDYAARYPQHAAAIRDLFPALAVIEGLAPIQVETLGPAWIDTHVDPAPSSHVGDYRILRQIGRGGMGVVYEAVQQSLSRHVALKVLPFHAADDAEMRERFHREAEAAARLDHPHIVPVYEVGEHEGCPYFSMKYVEGTTLAARLSAGPMPAREAAQLLLPVARAIAEAHRMGVLHRDLKPANILLDSEHRPLVADFGLAKRFEAGSDISRTNALAGTPSYMAPEQASGRWQEVGVATDVYGLGAVLYHMLTARPPFQAATVVETLKQVTHQDPVSPRQLNAAIDRDLDTICLKCLAKEPRARYESAAALADDLERYIGGRTIVARPVGRIARTLRWCRRNPAPTAALALLAVTCAALVGAYGATSRALADSERSHLQTRAVVNDFLVRIGEDPRFDRPGMQPLRRDLLTKARDHYEHFVARNGGDPALREELADTHYNLGAISQWIDTPQAALAAYGTAEQMQRELVQERPQSTARREALSKTLAATGKVHFRQHNLALARADYAESEQIRRQLVAEHADNREFARLLANAEMHLGLVEKADGDYDAARRQFDDAERLRRQLLVQDAASFEVRRDLAKGLFNHANLDMSLSNATVDVDVKRALLDDAEKRLDEATRIFDELDRQRSGDPDISSYLALCWRTLAQLKSRHSPAEANRLYALILPRLEDLAFQSPDVVACQVALGGAYMNLARWDMHQGDALSAIDRFQQARRVFETLVRMPTDDPTSRSDLAVTLRAIGELEGTQRRFLLAREYLQAAKELFNQLGRDYPQRAEFAAQRDACVAALAELSKKQAESESIR